MQFHLRNTFALFLTVVVGSWLARHFSWYSSYFWVDIVLHILSGIMFGLMWLWITRQSDFRSRIIFCLSIASFAVLMSVFWEFWEFAGWRIMPAHTPYYIPELGDTLGDILSGLVGGLIAALIYMRRR